MLTLLIFTHTLVSEYIFQSLRRVMGRALFSLRGEQINASGQNRGKAAAEKGWNKGYGE